MKYCDTCHSAYPNDFQVCPRDNVALRATSEIIEGLVIANKYQVLEKIGAGGMASVYRARHLAFNEVRAIKVINSRIQDESSVKRFRTEAVIARKLQHPHAVRIDDLDVTEDGRPFIVMEFVEGKSLRRTLREQGALPLARSLNIAAQSAEALAAAHEMGITHRDIKPDNILLASENGADFVKVLDFGIAKVREGAIDMGDDYTTTQTGMVVGTPAYISPEQARGKMATEVDGRADLYSLGVVLYEMVTGQLPFKSETSMEMILHHLHSPATPAHRARPDLHIPRSLSELLARAMAKDRQERFQSAQEMLAALRDPQMRAQTELPDRDDRQDDGIMLTGVRGSENYEVVPSQLGSVIAQERDEPGFRTDTVQIPARPRPVAAPPLAAASELLPPIQEPPKARRYFAWSTLGLLVLLCGLEALFLHRHPATRQIYAAHIRGVVIRVRDRFARHKPAEPVQRPTEPSASKSAPQPAPLGPVPSGSENPQTPIAQQASSQSTPPALASASQSASVRDLASLPAKLAGADKIASSVHNKPPVLIASNPRNAEAAARPAALVSSGQGALSGVVYDAAHHPASEITIELENPALGFDQSTLTGSDGRYSFSQVPTGRGYVLSAIKQGDTQASRAGIVIRGGERRSVSPPLRLPPEQPVSLNVRLYGKVFSAAGQPVGGASIKLENPKLEVSRGAIISADGDYSFTEVPPGPGYTISVIQNGNTLESRSGLTVDPASANPEQILLLYLKSH